MRFGYLREANEDMTKNASAKKSKPKVETEPDAWSRFEQAIHKVAPVRKAKKIAKRKG